MKDVNHESYRCPDTNMPNKGKAWYGTPTLQKNSRKYLQNGIVMSNASILQMGVKRV